MQQLQEIEKKLAFMEHAYYNSSDPSAIASDEEYDALLALYESMQKNPKPRIGAPVAAHFKTKLPHYMGSLDKIKASDESKLAKWANTSSYLVQPKLDGVSGLYVCNNESCSIYTRGDGIHGTNISSLLPYLKIPKCKNDIAVRGEIVMRNDVFQSKYATKFKNSRNLVSGVLNSKNPDTKILKDLIFIPYELFSNKYTPEQQLVLLHKAGFARIDYQVIPKPNIATLQTYWNTWNVNYLYPTDGIVLIKNNANPINVEGNPDYAIAFKQNKQTAMANVKQVLWNASKYNLLKPRIEIEPVDLGGTTISFLTGFNAKYIDDNNIGPSTVLEITRSGDVIPHITRIVSSTTASMPAMNYIWNETGVDIILQEQTNKQALVKQIHFFLKTLGIKHIAERSIEKMVAGNFDSVAKVLCLTIPQLQGLGFGPVESENIYKALTDKSLINNIPLYLLMTASGIFGHGVGTRKIQKLLQECPNVMTVDFETAISKIVQVDGWSYDGVRKFMQDLPKFKQFLIQCPSLSVQGPQLQQACVVENKNTQNIVFSGFRDKDLEVSIANQYKVVDAVNATVKLVIVKDTTKETTKTKKAIDLKIPVMSLEEFKAKNKF
jgi:DNA ligase (NAD+)